MKLMLMNHVDCRNTHVMYNLCCDESHWLTPRTLMTYCLTWRDVRYLPNQFDVYESHNLLKHTLNEWHTMQHEMSYMRKRLNVIVSTSAKPTIGIANTRVWFRKIKNQIKVDELWLLMVALCVYFSPTAVFAQPPHIWTRELCRLY
jgi:hypothetical protein